MDFGSRLLLWQSREVAVFAPRRGEETRILLREISITHSRIEHPMRLSTTRMQR